LSPEICNHGEPGRRRVPLASIDGIAAELCEVILRDLAPRLGGEVLLSSTVSAQRR